MGEKIENAAEVLGYFVLSIIAALVALVVMLIVRYIGKLYNRWKYDSLQRQNAEHEWDIIRESWIQKDRQDEDRNTVDGRPDFVDYAQHDTLELPDLQEQLYNYQEELRNDLHR